MAVRLRAIWSNLGSESKNSLPFIFILFQYSDKFMHSIGLYSIVLRRSQLYYILLIYCYLYNNPSFSRILIASCLWSIRGQMYDWRHHYTIFPSAVLKWRNVLRIRIIFYVTGQKISYKKVLPRHCTGSRSRPKEDKAVSFRKRFRNNFWAVSVGSRARLNHTQNWSW